MPEKLGLYIHIPFCKSKCAYCDFYSIAGCEDHERYVNALLLHMEDYSESVKERELDTIFIGGGTPSSMKRADMLDILYGIRKNFLPSKNAEYTMEVNPATIDTATFRRYKANGINRISIGVQSANDEELKALGRIHNFKDASKCFKRARHVGIKNINIDLMYGIPGQTVESLMTTLNAVSELDPEHISLYALKIEEGTDFAKRRDSLDLPDEDVEFEMYQKAVEFLDSRGYKQYEISNFAKPGYECKHNLKYWNCEEYLGLGPGAHSYFNDTRFSFKKDISLYIKALEHERSETDLCDEKYLITPKERVGEYIMLQLRLKRGINTEVFKEKFGMDFDEMFKKELPLYVEGGFMKQTTHGYAFTLKGMYVSNYILSSLLDFDSKIVSGIAEGSDK